MLRWLRWRQADHDCQGIGVQCCRRPLVVRGLLPHQAKRGQRATLRTQVVGLPLREEQLRVKNSAKSAA